MFKILSDRIYIIHDFYETFRNLNTRKGQRKSGKWGKQNDINLLFRRFEDEQCCFLYSLRFIM